MANAMANATAAQAATRTRTELSRGWTFRKVAHKGAADDAAYAVERAVLIVAEAANSAA